jgi:hypothetical protein
VGFAKLLGEKEVEGMTTYNLAGVFLGVDIVYQPESWGNFFVYLGPSFHFWQVDDVVFGLNAGDTDLKFGWRFGAGYNVWRDLRVELAYTFTEWRSDQAQRFQGGFNPAKPAYYTIKAAYNF